MGDKNLSQNLSRKMGQRDKIPEYRLKSGSWTWKRTGISPGNSTFGPITAITVLSVLLSCYGVVKEMDPKITAIFILTAVSGILWDDPLSIVCHFLATTIRRMFSVIALMWITAILAGSENYIMLIVVVTLITLPLGIKVNSRMLYSDTWKYSASVQHGLNMAGNSDTEKAWQDWGMAECRALYGYSGNDVDDQLIGRYAKPVFFLVYHKIRDRFIDRISRTESLTRDLMESRERIQNLESELEAAEQNLLEAKLQEDDTGIFVKQKEEIEHMAKLCADLTLANDELVEALKEKEVVTVNVPDERYLYLTPEERVKELLLRGKTYREIETITGISKTKVGRIAKEMESNYE